MIRALIVAMMVVFLDGNPEQPSPQPTIDQTEMACLADNVYFEARGEPVKGKTAVAYVTLNRVQSINYPKTICGVVHDGLTTRAGTPIKNRCQFAWWCDGIKDVVHDREAWADSMEIAQNAIEDYSLENDPTHGATHFHTTSIYPGWKDVKKTIKIGHHVFYKEA